MVRVVVLGSGASLPTLQRNTSALAVQRDGDVYLFDCGEGTQMQWRRAGLRFGKLRAVFVSHLHGDHVNGLVGLLQTLSLADRAEGLTVAGPPGIEAYLEAMRRHVGMRVGYPLEVREIGSGTVVEAPGYRIDAAPLEHGVPTFGYAVVEAPRPGRFDVDAARRLGVPEGPLFGRLQDGEAVVLDDGTRVEPSRVLGAERPGRRVAVCVDTRPCQGVLDLGREADLLVCDATFTEDLAVEARRRGHCTAGEAATMALEAGARRLLLTHVSARYHDAAPLLEEARRTLEAAPGPARLIACDVAADLMEIHL